MTENNPPQTADEASTTGCIFTWISVIFIFAAVVMLIGGFIIFVLQLLFQVEAPIAGIDLIVLSVIPLAISKLVGRFGLPVPETREKEKSKNGQ